MLVVQRTSSDLRLDPHVHADFAEQSVSPIGDGSNSGGTAEDRFFGVVFRGGVKRITMKNPGGGVEIDHLQLAR